MTLSDMHLGPGPLRPAQHHARGGRRRGCTRCGAPGRPSADGHGLGRPAPRAQGRPGQPGQPPTSTTSWPRCWPRPGCPPTPCPATTRSSPTATVDPTDGFRRWVCACRPTAVRAVDLPGLRLVLVDSTATAGMQPPAVARPRRPPPAATTHGRPPGARSGRSTTTSLRLAVLATSAAPGRPAPTGETASWTPWLAAAPELASSVVAAATPTRHRLRRLAASWHRPRPAHPRTTPAPGPATSSTRAALRQVARRRVARPDAIALDRAQSLGRLRRVWGLAGPGAPCDRPLHLTPLGCVDLTRRSDEADARGATWARW